uniref:Uncharacterized protein n=1 Tax=Cacopsylla melanoneura TaxID=428564 RepID=A0A8D8VYG0_9HEMI
MSVYLSPKCTYHLSYLQLHISNLSLYYVYLCFSAPSYDLLPSHSHPPSLYHSLAISFSLTHPPYLAPSQYHLLSSHFLAISLPHSISLSLTLPHSYLSRMFCSPTRRHILQHSFHVVPYGECQAACVRSS